MRTFAARIILAVGLLFGVNGAALATLIYTIGDPNSALTGLPAPYATATITLIDATHASVVFQALTTGGQDYMIGAAQALDLNVGASAFTVSPLPVMASTLTGFSTPSCAGPAPGNVSSFGVFNLTMDCFDGFPNSGKTFSFTLTNTSGTWGTESSVLVANGDGNFAAAHIFACNTNPCTATGGALVTGFAGNSEGGFPPVIIPEPQSLALMGLGLLVLGIARRRG